METILKLLPSSTVQGWIVTGILTGIGWLYAKAKKREAASQLSADDKALVEQATDVADEVLVAEAKATGGKVPTAADVPRLVQVGLAVLQARAPTLINASEVAAEDVLNHAFHLKIGTHAAIVGPGGAAPSVIVAQQAAKP